MSKRVWLYALTIIFVLAVSALFVACGGTDTTTGTATTATATETAVSSTAGGTIPIGILRGYTGAYADWTPGVHNSIELAANEINAAGGVLGKQIELVTADDESNSTGGKQGMQQLLAKNVAAVIGPESDPMLGLLDLAKENKVPVITSNAGTSELDKAGGTDNYIWRTCGGDSFLGKCEARIIYEQMGIKQMAIMYESTSGTVSAADNFIKNYEALGGTFVAKVEVNSGQSTYLSELNEAFAKSPELTYLAVSNTTGVSILKGWYERGYSGKWWVSEDLQIDDILKINDTVNDSLYAMGITEGEDNPNFIRFADAYKAAYNEQAYAGWYQSNSYDAMILTALAIQAAGEATGEAIDEYLPKVACPPGVEVTTFADGVKELAAGNDIDYTGASGKVDFNEYGNVASPYASLIQVKDGQWITTQNYDVSTY